MRKHSGNGSDLLQRQRKAIDLLDARLLRLLNQRARIASDLASVKKSSGLPLYDGRREQQILERICGQNPGPLDARGLTSIFRCIIRESRKIEAGSMRRLRKNHFPQENTNGHQYGGKRN